MTRRRWLQVMLSVSLSVAALLLVLVALPVRSAVPHLGYGFNVGLVGTDAVKLQQMQFNWIKIFDVPGAALPQSILLRVDVPHTTTISQLLDDLDMKLDYLSANHLAVQAWEIGNEPNIDASYGRGATPDPVAYKSLLCAAYAHLKAALPDAIVVSAGLAPTGRISTVPPYSDGNDGQAQDERKYLQQMLAAPGGICLDAVGYHPYGYSANYDAPPDAGSLADPPTYCENGFCFRGAEKIYEVMQANGVGDKKMWATEFGWLTQPADSNCLNDSSWYGRQWQIVSDSVQATNLAEAFQYADAHWPWMGAMFVFNLDFNLLGNLGACDQMRSYDIEGKPAQTALAGMVKNPASIQGKLKADISQLTLLIGVAEQPMTLSVSFGLSNWGWNSAYYTATASAGANVMPVFLNPTGMLSATAQQPLNLLIASMARVSGTYTGVVTVNWSASGVSNPTTRKVNVELRVVDQLYRTYLPLVMR